MIYLTLPILIVGVADVWYEQLNLQKMKQALQGASQGKQTSPKLELGARRKE
ncbi:hypothetical protein QUA26_26665 [Microcoleus sp. Pol12A4]|uniref:hypothetical protein n=1 Tax=Microcoleus sp. Pol12A4 TaxID=3055391 RepID=UPI002FD1F8C3